MPVPTLFSLSAKKLRPHASELRKELDGLHILKLLEDEWRPVVFVFNVSYNVLRIMSGMDGVAYSS